METSLGCYREANSEILHYTYTLIIPIQLFVTILLSANIAIANLDMSVKFTVKYLYFYKLSKRTSIQYNSLYY